MIGFASALWRLALAALLTLLAYLAFEFGLHFGDWAERILDREAGRLTAAATAEIDTTRREVLREVASLRRDTTRQLTDLRLTADARIAAIAASADAQLSRTNDTVAGFRADLGPTVQHVENITAHADDASAILLRRDALPAQVLGLTAAAKVTLGETAQTLRTVRDITAAEGPSTARAIREAAQQSSGIATDIHTFTTAAVAPVPWYRKIGSVLYTGARVGTAIF